MSTLPKAGNSNYSFLTPLSSNELAKGMKVDDNEDR